MPYRRNADLPESVRNVLPAEAQSVFRNVFNATVGDVGEERAFRQAWGALRNQGWSKTREGRWVKKAVPEQIPFTARFEVAKVDEEQGLVFGWASIAEQGGTLVVEAEGDVIEPQELEKGAYGFVRNARVASDSHRSETVGVGVLVESMFFSKEKQEILGVDVPVGWWVGFQIDDPEMRHSIREEGGHQMFSIGGSGTAAGVSP